MDIPSRMLKLLEGQFPHDPGFGKPGQFPRDPGTGKPGQFPHDPGFGKPGQFPRDPGAGKPGQFLHDPGIENGFLNELHNRPVGPRETKRLLHQ